MVPLTLVSTVSSVIFRKVGRLGSSAFISTGSVSGYQNQANLYGTNKDIENRLTSARQSGWDNMSKTAQTIGHVAGAFSSGGASSAALQTAEKAKK